MSLGAWCRIALCAVLSCGTGFAAQQGDTGSIRGTVVDADFDVPLSGAQVVAVEIGQRATTGDQGNFVLSQVPPGRYTIVVTKEGYVRQVRTEVLVEAGRLTDVDVALPGEFTEMDEFLVQDVLQLGAGTEAALLALRFDNTALLDSIGSDLMSRAGAGDAAAALRLVSGATVQDGKYAVVRGLPDRYVSSQMNGVRLPTADEDKRAVQLDQFPSAVIESIRVSKTFTPDQQGDASGGAVDVRLKGIPDETGFQLKGQTSWNTQVSGRSRFLSYDGGGVGFLGREGGERDIQYENLGGNWDGAVGTSRTDSPVDFKLGASLGGKHQIDADAKLGAFASLFYERDSAYDDDAVDDSYWVDNVGENPTPRYLQGSPGDGDFKTSLFDVTQGRRSVQWGGLATFGFETKRHRLGLTYLYTRAADDVATLAEDTRGKSYYFPGYDPTVPNSPGNTPDTRSAAPWLRTETLEYTERTTQTVQLSGGHELVFAELGRIGGTDEKPFLKFGAPRLDWTLSYNTADLYQPDKRQFGALWVAPTIDPGFPPFIPPSTLPAVWVPYKPAANFTIGNLQRIWKDIGEESEQLSANLTFPFEQWSGRDGYLKAGVFGDDLDRTFDQDTFSNFGDSGAGFLGDWSTPWSSVFDDEDHPITAASTDVDYRGRQEIRAWYVMGDLPVTSIVSVNGGVRFESTKLGISNRAEADATWFPAGATSPQSLDGNEADVDYEGDNTLPSLGITLQPIQKVTVRGSWSRTIARQTFKELTPILQQEYLGGPVFVGNPDLLPSELENWDVRVDYTPYDGGLFSATWFTKDVDRPIEYVQRLASIDFTTPVNYPKGDLDGWEFEARQDLGRWTPGLKGFGLGANATLLDSRVTISREEQLGFQLPEISAPRTTRDMTNAPEYLYNLFVTYDLESTGTQLALFYTVQGDTLVAGAGESGGNFVPDVYARRYDTLNLSLSQSLGAGVRLQLQAKNLTNPEIDEVYRSEYIDEDVRKSSYTKGIEFSLSLTANFAF